MSTKERVRLPPKTCGLGVLTLLLGLASCGDFMTDAATRLAYELEHESKALRRSISTTSGSDRPPRRISRTEWVWSRYWCRRKVSLINSKAVT